MKRKSIVSALVLFGVLLNAIDASAQPGGIQVNSNTKILKFDQEKFIDTINQNKLGAGILDGYAAVLIKDGKIVAEVAGGPAIRGDAKLANAAMTTSTPNHIGSDFKIISFIAVLSVFEKRAAKNPALTVEKQLNEPILPYLPRAWRNYIVASAGRSDAGAQATARIAKTTFAQLMAHRSGFRPLNLPANTPPSPFNYIAAGIQQANVGARVYSNFNATIITYLLPRLVDPGKADLFDDQAETAKVALNSHKFFGKLYGDFFENWMQSNVFDAIAPAIRPSCDPAVDYPKRNPPVTFARFYATPLGGENPQYWSEKDNNFGCHAQGGYYMSMRQLAAFMANYQATDTLVSSKTRKLIYDDSTRATRDAGLVFFYSESDFTKKNFGVNAIPFHLGSGADGYSNTAILILPAGYIAVGTISSQGNAQTVFDGLKTAWGEAVKGNFE